MYTSPIVIPSGGVSRCEPKNTDGCRRRHSLIRASRMGYERVQSKFDELRIGSISSRSLWSHSGYRARWMKRIVRAVAVVSLRLSA